MSCLTTEPAPTTAPSPIVAPGEDQRLIADPDIVAHLHGCVRDARLRREMVGPLTELRVGREPIGQHVVDAMLAAQQDVDTVGEGAELTNLKRRSGSPVGHRQVAPGVAPDAELLQILTKVEPLCGRQPRGSGVPEQST